MHDRGLAIAAIVLAGASLPVTSITVAVAIPAFMHYVKRSKAMEARTNVETLYRGVEAYVDAHGELPPDIARAPALVPGVHETAWSAEERARFENIGFAATRSTRYAYSVDVDESTATVIVRALGDLDGDGVLATYELRGHLDPRNGLQRDGRIETTLELE